MHDFIRYGYIYIWHIGFRVGVTHRFGELRIRNHRLRIGEEVVVVVEVVVPFGVEVAEVVDVMEVVILGLSSWRALTFRASESLGFLGIGGRTPVFSDTHEGGRHKTQT